MLQQDSSLDPIAVYTILEQTAIDMGTPGFDFDSGNGLVDGFAALQTVGGPPEAIIPSPMPTDIPTAVPTESPISTPTDEEDPCDGLTLSNILSNFDLARRCLFSLIDRFT